MAQDIRELFKNDKIAHEKMPKNHQDRFLKKLDKLCIKYKILPSVIKDSRLNSDTFEKCYDQSIIFKDMLNKFDKKRIYQSELSKRLKI